MTSFENAYNKVMIVEGGWVNDPDDSGGETYKGIARRYNPEWPGWTIIDNDKIRVDFPACLDVNPNLQQLLRNRYKKNYWDPFLGDLLEENIAEEMFDQAVNLGLNAAIFNLQRSVNILNRNRKDYKDITADGKFGSGTFQAYQDCIRHRGAKLLFNVLNTYQGKKYIDIMESNPVKEKYIGWFSRLEIKRT